MSVLKVEACRDAGRPPMQGGALDDAFDAIYDLRNDPLQRHAVQDAELECRFYHAMVDQMRQNDAPPELYDRFALR